MLPFWVRLYEASVRSGVCTENDLCPETLLHVIVTQAETGK